MIMTLKNIATSFWEGFTHVSRKQCIRAEKKMREHLSEDQIDDMLDDSFPASDPPSTY